MDLLPDFKDLLSALAASNAGDLRDLKRLERT